jgi:hypothetical protein
MGIDISAGAFFLHARFAPVLARGISHATGPERLNAIRKLKDLPPD